MSAPAMPAAAGLSRRLLLGGALGAAGVLAARPALAATAPLPAERTTTSPEGIIRTLLERAELPDGRLFELILDTFPPGFVAPLHHHPAPGLNYVLSGTGESQYKGEALIRLKPGMSFVDRANTPHIHFRNTDPGQPLIVLLSHVLKPGQPFFELGRG